MRITNNMLVNNMLRNIGRNQLRMDRYQNMLATGKKILVPSDDPIVATRALKLRTNVAEIRQFKTNVTDGVSWLQVTENALSDVGDTLQRMRELAVQASNGTNNPEETQKIGEEVKQLRGQIINLANSTYAGRNVFSGFKTNQKLIDPETGEFNIDVDNAERIIYEIGIGDNINVNVAGGDVFNNGASATGGNVGKMLQDIDDFIAALDVGDFDAISIAITELDDNKGNLLRVRAGVGARINRLELTANRLDNDDWNFTKLMSENEDVDMAEAIMHLKNEENVYMASLSAGARIIQPTLVDFLR